jgi:phosphatidylinositol phospholipase C delta
MDKSSRVVPEWQAEDGNPSTASVSRTTATLSEPVLQHLKDIFNSLSDGNKSLSLLQAATFLDGIQKASDTRRELGPPGDDEIAFYQFLKYTTSPAFDALAPPTGQDLSFPLSNYYISSSHNTYLTGNQLYGRSTIDGYKNVSLAGEVKCMA